MPFVIAKVNVPVSKEQESKIKTRIGKAIENVPGKNENYHVLGRTACSTAKGIP